MENKKETKELTLDEFNAIPAGEIFAKGKIENSPEGMYMSNSGGMLKWIAKKGDANDWAVYVHWATSSFEYVRTNGDKSFDKRNIKKVVPCTDEVFKKYRY